MSIRNKISRFTWKIIRFPPQTAYRIGLGGLIGRFVLLLTTTGRKSGLPRVTALQYEEVDGLFYIGSARGERSDWYQNIQVQPEVEVQVKQRSFHAQARTVTDPITIADFLALRLQRHPNMLGLIFRIQGYPRFPSREQLEYYARGRALVIVQPFKVEEINHMPASVDSRTS